jgi:poly-gamma-glutamate capsule biosynthesis protein CapA/YwtB (metallophosphatase superfamily)
LSVRRRDFLTGTGLALLSGPISSMQPANAAQPGVTLFLCGDVMTGRGIDQILGRPSKPHLHEQYVRSALGYVDIAERASGPIDRPAKPDYIWGDALTELERVRPDARIINLETAVTTAEDAWPGKGIHYRMHPANASCLTAARIDCCVLANNHVLDWGYTGLAETLDTLRTAGIRTVGAGRDDAEAAAPATIELSNGNRVVVFAFDMASAGVPEDWAATAGHAGVNLLRDLSGRAVARIASQVRAVKRSGDVIVVSLHWGSNWGYAVPRAQREFAHRLIDTADVDVVHGHSSHHPKGIEVHHDRLVLYGCGDFLNDYEGITGHASFRSDLALMYFPTVNAPTGDLTRLLLTPTRIRHFRVDRVRGDEVSWLERMLSREGRGFGTSVERLPDETLGLRWHA